MLKPSEIALLRLGSRLYRRLPSIRTRRIKAKPYFLSILG
jgi:hypothetical protein